MKRALMTTVAVLAAVLASAAPAQARPAPGPGYCAAGSICMFSGTNATGYKVSINYSGVNDFRAVLICAAGTAGCRGRTPDGRPTFNDSMRSWVNNSGRQFCWYPAAAGGGTKHPMPSLGGWTIQNLYTSEYDTASSLYDTDVLPSCR